MYNIPAEQTPVEKSLLFGTDALSALAFPAYVLFTSAIGFGDLFPQHHSAARLFNASRVLRASRSLRRGNRDQRLCPPAERVRRKA